jgi:hypothetical protein
VVAGLPRGRTYRLGVHTPEFSFEHEIDRVRYAIREREIDSPLLRLFPTTTGDCESRARRRRCRPPRGRVLRTGWAWAGCRALLRPPSAMSPRQDVSGRPWLCRRLRDRPGMKCAQRSATVKTSACASRPKHRAGSPDTQPSPAERSTVGEPPGPSCHAAAARPYPNSCRASRRRARGVQQSPRLSRLERSAPRPPPARPSPTRAA